MFAIVRVTFAVGLCWIGSTAGLLPDVVTRCCELGRTWAAHSQSVCGPYPIDVSDPSLTGVSNVNEALACISAVDACCVAERRSTQCDVGRQTALTELACHGLHLYGASEDAKECCNCCRLGALHYLLGQPCRIESTPLLAASMQCADSFGSCCLRRPLLSGPSVDRPLAATSGLSPPAAGHPLSPTTPMMTTTTTVATTTTTTNSDASSTLPFLSGVCAEFEGQLCAHECIDTPVSYRCACRDGFVLMSDGKTCQEATASSGRNRCLDHGTRCEQLCIDTGREIHCNCRDGYLLNRDGRTCQDVDECIAGTHTCMPGTQTCVNTVGAFVCANATASTTASIPTGDLFVVDCPDHSVWNAELGGCVDVRTTRRATTSGGGACPPGSIWNSESLQCDVPLAVTVAAASGRRRDEDGRGPATARIGVATRRPSRTGGSRPSSRCGKGYAWSRMSLECEDIDECVIGTHTCDPTQFCENTDGHYICHDEEPTEFYDLDRVDPDASAFSAQHLGDEEVVDVEYGDGGGGGGGGGGLVETVEEEDREKASDDGHVAPSTVMVTMPPPPPPPTTTATTTTTAAAVPVTERPETARGRSTGDVTTSGRRTAGTKCADGYGYDRSSKRCVDIDECETGSHDCHLPNQVCFNTPGGHYCRCLPGYHFNAVTVFCEDVDECEAPPGGRCGSDQTCENTLGSYICHCVAFGHELDPNTKLCVDIDECARSDGLCADGQTCLNTPGSYLCIGPSEVVCEPGFAVVPGGRRCVDVDECQQNVCRGTGSRCVNTVGSYRCQCEPGYQRDPLAQLCVDIDECSDERRQVCTGEAETCLNTIGSFECTCQSGYVFDSTQQRCLDEDECQQAVCRSTGSRCVNTVGSYICQCESGYQLDPASQQCVDVDECQQNACGSPGSRCVNTVGSYRCRCETGYQLDTVNQRCVDVDECTDARRQVCTGEVETCRNTIGSFECTCQSGYMFDRARRRCLDVDECQQDVCRDTGSSCVNTIGSYICQCQPGYQLNAASQQCVDVDECQLNACPNTGSRCVNTVGSYSCQCETGYQLDSSTQQCVDLDECSDERRQVCTGEAETCRNTVGSFECTCQSGYMFDRTRQRCLDVDECRQRTHNCGVVRNCVNTHGSFECVPKTCPSGYRLDHATGNCQPVLCARGMRPNENGQCVDLDECVEHPGVCRPHEHCINTVGSYTCRSAVTCGPGFEMNDVTAQCDDVDECQRGTHRCRGADMECVNRPGTYVCQCREGYQLNVQYQTCEDIDECQLYGGQICSQSARCENMPGSFRCICRDGFETVPDSPTSCRDVDECLHPMMCQHTCQNSYGSFHCLCNDGYELAADRRSCQDVDECSVYSRRSTPLCHGICENTPGSYVCSCPPGYQLGTDSRSCRDVDECASGQSDINCDHPDDVCINTRGGFKCERIECPKGFAKVPTTTSTRSNSVRCQRKTYTCPQGDVECLYAPLSYSVNFITLTRSSLRIPADLFTMRGPLTARRRLQFELKLIGVRDPQRPEAGHVPGSTRINDGFFIIEQMQPNEAVVKLVQDVGGAPYDVELQLNMHVYSREYQPDEIFYGTAVSRIFIYITDDPW